MPEEKENQIERRDSGGGIGRRSDVARRGMNAANYVRGLATKTDTELEVAGTTAEYSFEFLSKWGSEGEGDGEFSLPLGLAIDCGRDQGGFPTNRIAAGFRRGRRRRCCSPAHQER